MQEKAKIISVIAAKGGVGKTTSAVSLAIELSKIKNGKNKLNKVLLVDNDVQANATTRFLQDFNGDDYNCLFDVYRGTCDTDSAIIDLSLPLRTKTGGVKYRELALLPMNRREKDFLYTLNYLDSDNRHLLKNAISQIVNDYDYIIIDCQPATASLGSIQAYLASDYYIPVCTPNMEAVTGIAMAMEQAIQIAVDHDHHPKNFPLLHIHYRKRPIVSRFISNVKKNFDLVKWSKNSIPYCHKMENAIIDGVIVQMETSTSKAAHAYEALAREYIQFIKQDQKLKQQGN